MSRIGPVFALLRYNPRGEAAEVEVTWPEGERELWWMSENDVRNNLMEFGPSTGLLEALHAYRKNEAIGAERSQT